MATIAKASMNFFQNVGKMVIQFLYELTKVEDKNNGAIL